MNRVLSYIVNTSIVIMFVSCVLQVLFRYLLNLPLSWSEELARLNFIWSVFLGAAILSKNKEHLEISFIFDKLNVNAKRIIQICQAVGIVLLLIILGYNGLGVLKLSFVILAPGLGIPRFVFYLPIYLSFILIILFNLDEIYVLIKRKNQLNKEGN